MNKISKAKHFDDLTGKTIGNWKVIEFAGRVSGGAISWLCECVCGHIREIRSSNVKSGKPKSCGCHKERDLIGYKTGMLKVIGKGKRIGNNGEKYWLCECECGKHKEIIERSLIYDVVKSCGCLVRGRNTYEFIDSYVVIRDENSESFIVDLNTYNEIKNTYWSIEGSGEYKYVYGAPEHYARRVRLHRYLLGLDSDSKLVVDHINHNTLDNRLQNLRVATRSENAMNMRLPTHNTSGYKGIAWNEREGRWIAYIKKNQLNQHIGYFDNIEDAIEARKDVEIKMFGEFSNEYGHLA